MKSKRKISINVLNKSSIEEAIKQVEIVEMNAVSIISRFLEESAKTIVEQANRYLDLAEFNTPTFVDAIKAQWVISPVKIDSDKVSISVENTADHAVWFEFGIGELGGRNPYPNDFNPDAYQYDINGHGIAGWRFLQKEQIDIPVKSYTIQQTYYRNFKEYPRKRPIVWTIGYEGINYAYKALRDFVINDGYKSVMQKVMKEFTED